MHKCIIWRVGQKAGGCQKTRESMKVKMSEEEQKGEEVSDHAGTSKPKEVF